MAEESFLTEYLLRLIFKFESERMVSGQFLEGTSATWGLSPGTFLNPDIALQSFWSCKIPQYIATLKMHRTKWNIGLMIAKEIEDALILFVSLHCPTYQTKGRPRLRKTSFEDSGWLDCLKIARINPEILLPSMIWGILPISGASINSRVTPRQTDCKTIFLDFLQLTFTIEITAHLRRLLRSQVERRSRLKRCFYTAHILGIIQANNAIVEITSVQKVQLLQSKDVSKTNIHGSR